MMNTSVFAPYTEVLFTLLIVIHCFPSEQLSMKLSLSHGYFEGKQMSMKEANTEAITHCCKNDNYINIYNSLFLYYNVWREIHFATEQ